MHNDIEGVIRAVIGFNKIPDEDGDHLMEVEYRLKPIDLDYLRQLFGIDPNDPDPGFADMLYCFDINEAQAKALQPYVIDGIIDLDKYKFELDCSEEPKREPIYTIQDLKNSLVSANLDEKLISAILIQLAERHNNVNELLDYFNATSKISSAQIQCARMIMLMKFIKRELKIEDGLLARYLEQGINDPDRNVSNHAKRGAGMLKKSNPFLFSKLSSKYNLEEIY